MKVLPTLYCIPKSHKSSIGAKFIIKNKKCVIKTLSKNIAVFKFLYKYVENIIMKACFTSELTHLE